MKNNRFNTLPAFMRLPAPALETVHAPDVTVEPHIFIQPTRGTDSEIWLQAWLHVAGAANCTNKESADAWADHCLAQYKNRFGGPV
jgi:hypothetical protein